MKIGITGGTGFVGSHTVAALRAAGHQVRLLVRRRDTVRPALEPLGLDPATVEIAVADVRDRDAVAAGLDGLDALVHAASVYSFDPRRADEIARINDEGVKTVLEAAVTAGLDPIVHVSSTLALVRDDLVADTLSERSPVGNSPFPYSASKARQEAFARRLQDEGAPIVITNPGGVWGPHDPHDGESQRLARAAIHGRMAMLPEMIGNFVDVRDVAAVHAAVMQSGRGARRFVIAGNVLMDDVVAQVTRAYGRPRGTIRVPLAATVALGRLSDRLRRQFGIDLGIDGEAIWAGSRRAKADTSRTTSELGVTLRPFEQTVRDQVQWMKEHRRI